MGIKALTQAEKQIRLLKYMNDNPEPYTLKGNRCIRHIELEKIGIKQLGIVANTVKDTLDALVGDGFVQQEKALSETLTA